jgi:hypothetical protein
LKGLYKIERLSKKMSDSNSKSAGGGGGNEKSNVKSEKVDLRKNIKCNDGKKCSRNPCPYKHSPSHVPYVDPDSNADNITDAVKNMKLGKMCRYDKNCHNTNCKFNHSDGYVPHPIARCKFGEDCDWIGDDIDEKDKCNYSHPTDKWWSDLPEISKPTFNSSTRGRGGASFRGSFRGRGGRSFVSSASGGGGATGNKKDDASDDGAEDDN